MNENTQVTKTPKKIAIIGSGPAGLTAAIYTSRANITTHVYTGLQPGGQLTTTTEIENFPGFVDGISGPQLMLNMEAQAKRFGSKIIIAEVNQLEVKKENESNIFVLKSGSKQEEIYDAIIIATGASPRYLGIPKEINYIGKGYHTCATCDGFFYRGKVICVVGGGDSAMEEANFLTKFASKVYLIHRSDQYKASKIMLDRAKSNPKIEFLPHSQITDFLTNDIDKIVGVKIENIKDKIVSNLNLEGIFVAIGHIPNSQFVNNLDLTMNDLGYLVPQSRMNPEDRISQYDTATKIEGIFVAGDIEDYEYRQAITAAGNGCKAAIDIERWLGAKL